MKTVWKNSTSALCGCFFLTKTISKVDDIKIKSKVSAFFLTSTRLSSFHYPPFFTFCPFTGPKEDQKVH